ncbi:hypothetical protein [Pseudomonas sp.]|uniref:hypothetical protein n=1 Tax=Pseudomonas sp. TaxID=306 RepID=UPI00273388B9|nr:hypothetical protein [Pseudomonas sp.]MDP3817103.1 hypothetical protein [Pseudomonas sp.]
MHKFASAVMLLTLVAQPVLASQTACIFSTGKTSHYYELEFIGYSDTKPMLVFSSTTFRAGQRTPLPPADLKHFSQKARSVSLAFRNPEDPALPPSFTLAGTGDHAWLTIGSARLQGDLKCAD